MSADEKTLEAMLHAERQWRADVLEVLLRLAGFAEASAEAGHAALAALAEIRALLVVELPPEEGEPAESMSVADLLESLAADVTEAGQAANLLESDDSGLAEGPK